MWSGGGSGQRYPAPDYYTPNPSPYIYPSIPSAQQSMGGIPTLSHRGAPSPHQQQQQHQQYGQASAPPVYGYQPPPPAGFVPPSAYPYPNQTQPHLASGEDEWISVNHKSPFPSGAVQAMDRPLSNNDHNCKNCYVALWNKNGEPVFGRAWNNNGKVEAWFPYGGDEHYSGNISSFQMLTYRGPPWQNFRYAWVPMNQFPVPMCEPVSQKEISPAVIRDVRAGSFNGELLGKAHFGRKMAWISHAGKEHHFTDGTFHNSYLLCRVPL